MHPYRRASAPGFGNSSSRSAALALESFVR
jgi:hypothetical protein